VGPEEALALRLVDDLVEPQELLARALERALELAAMPAYAIVKAQVRGPLIAELERIVSTPGDPLPGGAGPGLAAV
jgi:enoyl-CoA hydratase/carnithine racemase